MWPFGRKQFTRDLFNPGQEFSGSVRSCVVDNRVFLLGLDNLYRSAMQRHERGELLVSARRVAATLQLTPANMPVEGYYAEEPELTEYFRLVRALQEVDESRTAEVATLREFQRLRAVMSAPLYGRPQYGGKLLPVGWDPLSQALEQTLPEWTVARLTAVACTLAQEADDISLVGLAARSRDAVVLAAMRESVVLYAGLVVTGIPPRKKYGWKVDDELAEAARRFIGAFNELFGEELPPPDPNQAERYWWAYKTNEILGRCVRLGYNNAVLPIRHYHWGICSGDGGEFEVNEFWQSEIWTTSRYRAAISPDGRCFHLESVAVPTDS